MYCTNHPNVASIANCQTCGVGICGQCMQFIDFNEYCEACAEAMVAESYIAARARELEERQRPRFEMTMEEPPSKIKQANDRWDKDRTYVWLGFGGASAMIFFSLVIYAFPMLFQFDSALAAERRAYQALEDCRLVFEEIGYLLEDGLMPDDSLRCVDTAVPNIIQTDGDAIRVSHPDPTIYGLVELYVSSQSHEVIFVEAREV